ncbi:syndecan-2 [Oncorhynchus tshawytscha]|uniref:Syndecan n=1 Tax=Oncorhynchus tshawytscha TaxID=74940 RepID=A0AAZ3QIA4_ONCTS|nr:syndecan-2 [Oncorhynchus tshawytscha]
MRNIWIILTLGITAFLSGERIAVAAKSSSEVDDLFIDDTGSGGYYPEDDDDFNSGSGSGTAEEVIEETVTVSTLYIAPKAVPTQDSTKDFTPRVETDTPREDLPGETPWKPVRTEPPVPVTEDVRKNQITSTPSSPLEPIDVRSENLFQRTEVLAAVIAGGVIGFLFAIFLILLLVYRMRKKDEGSYDLGERKPSGAAYQKAPTKEFYA